MVNRIAPLDLEQILINSLAGDVNIFFGIMILGIVILAGFFRIPDIIMGVFFVMAGAFMFQFVPMWFLATIMVGGILIFWVISRVIKR